MKFQNIVLIGGGVLGSQIAYQTAYAGFHTTALHFSISRSDRVDLPWSMWAIMEKLRILLWSVMAQSSLRQIHPEPRAAGRGGLPRPSVFSPGQNLAAGGIHFRRGCKIIRGTRGVHRLRGI